MGLEEVDRREQPTEEEGEDLDDLDEEAVVDLDDDEELEEDVPDEAGDEEEVAEAPVVVVDDSEQESLDELLDQRRASRLASDEPEEDDDLVALTSIPISREAGVVVKASPVKDRHEFVCNRCHLVKAKVQLADTARGLCRDCV